MNESRVIRWRRIVPPGAMLLLLPIVLIIGGCVAGSGTAEAPPRRDLGIRIMPDGTVVRGLRTVSSTTKAPPAETQASDDADDNEGEYEDDNNLAQIIERVESVFGTKGRMDGDDVYAIRFPRPDLAVSVEGMDVPTNAGIYTEFRFYHCPCGKAVVIGQFVTADYEANDVLASLQESHMHVASLGPFLLHEHPRLLAIRFHAEGRSRKLAMQLKKALEWTGPERFQPQKPLMEPEEEEAASNVP